MATHDYIISNASGAAVRSDLNNALSAIVSNNSSATEPATTYAYQMWADIGSTPAVMKLRDSSNSSWITLYKLDGTSLPTSSATEIAFNDAGADLDFRIEGDNEANLFYVDAGNDRIGIGTSSPDGELDVTGTGDASGGVLVVNDAGAIGVEVVSPQPTVLLYETDTTDENYQIRLDSGDLRIQTQNDARTGASTKVTIDSTGNVGIGTASPSVKLDVSGQIKANNDFLYADATATRGRIYGDSTGLVVRADSGLELRLHADGSEAARIDSSGRLLVGDSSNSTLGKLVVRGRGTTTGAAPATMVLQRNSAAGSSDGLGELYFADDDESILGYVSLFADGTQSGSSKPSKLTFATTASSATSPTERKRINSAGTISSFAAGGNPCYTIQNAGGASGSTVYIQGLHSASSITSGGSASIYIFTNGNVQNTNNSYGAISDQTLKENIAPANSQWQDLKDIEVVNYNFKEETGHQTHTQLGVIAQQVEAVSPGLVNTNDDGLKSVSYSVLYMKAVKALQEAMERIETLEAKVAALESA